MGMMEKDESKSRSSEKKKVVYFPLDTVEQILLRLPSRDLARFNCVSKSFLNLINDPSFENRRLAKAVNLFFLENRCSYTLTIKQEECILRNRRFAGGPDVKVFGTFNGLICLRRILKEYEELILFNPETGEYKQLPLHVGLIEIYGFGYDPSINDYKLLIVLGDNTTMLYSLKSNSWKKLENWPFGDHHNVKKKGLFLNGALHWLKLFGDTTFFCRFKFDEEKFDTLALPSFIPETDVSISDTEVIERRLCITSIRNYYQNDSNSIQLWTMLEYGVAESWTKVMDITISDELMKQGFRPRMFSLLYMDNGKVLFRNRSRDQPLVWFDPGSNTWKHVRNSIPPYYDQGAYYEESLASPNKFLN